MKPISEIVWISVIAYSMIQGYLLFFIFPNYKGGSSQAKWLLATASLLCALLLTNELLVRLVGYETLPHLIFATSPIWYVIGPVIFFYIRLYTTNKKLNWLDSLHLLPMFFVVASSTNFYLFSGDAKLYYFQQGLTKQVHPIHNTNFILFAFQSALYLIMSINMIRAAYSQFGNRREFRWIKQLVIGLGVLSMLGLSSVTVLNFQLDLIIDLDSLYSLVISIFLLGLFLNSVRSSKEAHFIGKPPRLSHIARTNIENNDLFENLVKHLEEVKPYNDPEFDIQSLARNLGCSKHQLSKTIKLHAKVGFKDFVNQYRIADAKQKLVSPLSEQYTIQSIANDSGFASLATFYRIFKKIEGTTPKSFIQQSKGRPHFN